MNNSANSRWFTIITLFLVTANIVTLTFLWIHHKGNNRGDNRMPPPNNGPVLEFLTHELQLDSAQQNAFAKLREEHRQAQRDIQDSIRKAKDAFFALLQTNPDDAVLQAAVKKVSDVDAQLDLLTFRHFQKVRAICTPEQQKKFDNVIQDVLRRMAPGKNNQDPHQPPPPGVEGPGRMPPPPPGEENHPPQEH